MNFRKFATKILSSVTAVTIISTGFSMFPTAETYAADVVTVDTTTEYQTIRGFGGINLPEWISQGDMTDAQVQKAFGNGKDELGLTILRIYCSDDSNAWKNAIPTAKRAQALGATIFATPWNPPASMRINGDGKITGGKYQLRKDKWADYAQHLNNFVKYVEGQGINLYSISVQNEPDYAEGWTYWSPNDLASFIAQYGKSVTSGTKAKLMSPESFQYRKDIYNAIFSNPQALANTDLFGTHFYGTQRSQMDFPTIENSGKELWMTEVYVPNSDADSSDRWPESLQVSENIHNGLVVGGLNAYVWWYIRRSYSPMKENGQISKRGYCMAQYSKFVRPGDVRIAATEIPSKDVYVSAYKNNKNQVTVVAVNKSSEGYAQKFNIGSGEKIVDVDRYRTSANENLAVTENLENDGSGFFAQLPASSVSTFVISLEGSGKTPEPEKDENGYYFHDTFEGTVSDWTARGSASVTLSGRTAYEGKESLLVQERTSTWHGGTKSLDTRTFVPGQKYSFSSDVMYFDGESTENFFMKLQYKGSDNETHYSTVAQGTAVKGNWLHLANTAYEIPAGATDIQLYVETESGTQNFYIDDAVGAPEGTVIAGAAPVDIPVEQPTQAPEENVDFSIGDINGDGAVDVYDMISARTGLVNGGFSTKRESLAADVNSDGTFNIADVVLLQEYILGKADISVPEKFSSSNTEEETSSGHMSMADYTAKVSSQLVERESAEDRAEKSGVSYGTIKKGSYYSTTCNRQKNYNILLPANYDENKKYPVLYALHGYWQNEDTFTDTSDQNLNMRALIGNAIASGEAKDMIVVCPDIYSSATQAACSAMDDTNNAAYDNFINDLTKDLMPYIEANYPVKTGRDNTAVTGFSMGGRESLLIGMKRPDLFGYVGAICPAPGVNDVIQPSDFKYTGTEPYLLLLTAGGNDTVVYSTPSGYNDILNDNGVPHIWHYVNGGYHGGNSMSAHLYNFVRWIFKA